MKIKRTALKDTYLGGSARDNQMTNLFYTQNSRKYTRFLRLASDIVEIRICVATILSALNSGVGGRFLEASMADHEEVTVDQETVNDTWRTDRFSTLR